MDLTEATGILTRTPAVLEALLADLPPAWLNRDDGPGSWSAYDIVGHLRHGEDTDWLPRARIIMEHGTGRQFEPFDREAMLREEEQPIRVRLAQFRAARERSLAELAALGLGAGDLARRGIHPAIGEVSLGQLLATWVAHDLTHLAQIGEVLARNYRTDVGPWRTHLPALERTSAAE